MGNYIRIDRSRPKSWFEKHRFFSFFVGFILILAILAHLYLHAYLIRYVNRKLNNIPDYRAHLEDIGIHLWRGAYSIEGINVLKRDGSATLPFFKAKTIDISLQWKELLHRHIVAQVLLEEPQINFISSANKNIQQTGVDDSGQDQVKALIPFK
jgi:hypothetical protein